MIANNILQQEGNGQRRIVAYHEKVNVGVISITGVSRLVVDQPMEQIKL